MHERRVGVACPGHVMDGRQFLQIERHPLGQVFGFGAPLRQTRRNRLAHIAHLVSGEDGLDGAAKPFEAGIGLDPPHLRKVGRGEDEGLGALRLDHAP